MPKIPLKKAWKIILASVILVGSTAAFVIFLFNQWKENRAQNDKFWIEAIAQTCSENERLKTCYLAELLDLSVDRPCSLHQFDVREGQKKLLGSPLIKSAIVKKIPPRTIYVEYILRKPIAFSGDYTNTAIDIDGYAFPFKPFFTPKKLPEVYIGLSGFGTETSDGEGEAGHWGCQLQGPRAKLALELYKLVLKHCCNENTHLLKIDTSKAYDLSYGQRQIVVVLEDTHFVGNYNHPVLWTYPKILRLSAKRYRQELANYMALNKFLTDQTLKQNREADKSLMELQPMIIDLRILDSGFVSSEG
jgi:hypothetical protein